MTNREIAAILFNISSLLIAQHGNPYRIRAYRRAARNILRVRHSLAERARNQQPLGVPFLGERLTKTITGLALDGTCDVYEELVGELPTAQQRLLHVPGIGPKLAERITNDLKAEDAEELIQRAATVGLQRVWGIGPKRARLIVDELKTETAPEVDTPFVRDGNVIYVQESFWNAERKNAA
ncbi:MAG TPA: helix-hairpin-helix domain-containing protein [Herpetosiphonaceae bacterium]